MRAVVRARSRRARRPSLVRAARRGAGLGGARAQRADPAGPAGAAVAGAVPSAAGVRPSWPACCRSPLVAAAGAVAVGGVQPGAVREPGAADHQRRHHPGWAPTATDATAGDSIGGWNVLCVRRRPELSRRDEEPSVRSARQRSFAVDYVRDAPERGAGSGAGQGGAHAGSARACTTSCIRTWARSAPMGGVGWHRVVLGDGGRLGVRRAAAGSPKPVAAAPAVLVVLCTTVLFYGGHRIRSSAEPIAGVVQRSCRGCRRRSRCAVGAHSYGDPP